MNKIRYNTKRRAISLLLVLFITLAGCGKDEKPSLSPPAPEAPEAMESMEPVNTGPVTITIPEGCTLVRIGTMLEDNGICSAEDFIEAAQMIDYSEFPLPAEQPVEDGRCFRLEGYLFPDTYECIRGENPDAIIRRMLENAERRISLELRAIIAESGKTVDEVLTMASLIEKEAVSLDQMPMIASVLHNRLDAGLLLENTSTGSYIRGVLRHYGDGGEDEYAEFYDTGVREGLPVGPICNPGLAAIQAALEPAESDWLYFIADPERNYHYAATEEKHVENIQIVREMQREYTTTITIPEGYTLARVGMLLEEKEICTATDFIEAAQGGDYSDFPLLAGQKQETGRCFRLEGYLYPDTYEVYRSEAPEAIIRKLLTNAERRIDAELREKIEQSGFTTDEIITIASIVEKESYGLEHMPMVSSVLHNRLDSGMRLQCDVTIVYVEGAIKPFISGDVNRYNGYYNTYKCDGLPTGAVCNPGIEAIRAALEPAESEYLYFVTDHEKNFYFAESWLEHESNVEAVKAVADTNNLESPSEETEEQN